MAKLGAALARALPKIRLDAPRRADGELVQRVLSPEAFDAFSGVLGHYHVQKNKTDPGPAFDWGRFLAEARAQRDAAEPSSGPAR